MPTYVVTYLVAEHYITEAPSIEQAQALLEESYDSFAPDGSDIIDVWVEEEKEEECQTTS